MTTPHRADADGAELAASDAPRTVAAICMYLLAEDGAWRAARPLREHRCTAASPLVAPSLEKQRRLCLIDDHVHCPAYLTAREALARDRGVSVEDLEAFEERLASRVPRSVPIAPGSAQRDRRTTGCRRRDETGHAHRAGRGHARRRGRAPGGSLRGWRPSRICGGYADGVARGGESDAERDRCGIAQPFPLADGQPVTEPEPESRARASAPKPSASPSPSLPAPTRTYTVQAGDTLIGIAAKFNTTVAILQALNGIDDPRLIHTGQVLKIP